MDTPIPVRRRPLLDRPPTSAELAKWRTVEARTRDLDGRIFCASLLFQNLVIMSRFATAHGITPPTPDAARLYALIEGFEKVKEAVRRIEDREWGARWNGEDFDAVDPAGSSTLGGLFIPVLIGVGVVALGGIIARLAYLEKETADLVPKYNAIIDRTDKAFCADPTSQTCQDWQQEKIDSGYEKNKSFADSVKGAISTVGSGLGKGLLIALPLVAFAIFWRGRR